MARFEEVARNRGVDSAVPGHEWMMVPHDGDNLVRLADGDGYVVAEPGRGRLTIREVSKEYMVELRRTFGPLSLLMPPNTRVFRVGGRAPGETTLVATKGSQRTALTVSVHRKRTYRIAFYFLQDRSEPLGFYDRPSKVIVVQDQFVADPWAGRTAPMLKTIAHEIGHYLNHLRGAGQGHDFFRGSGYTADILNTLDGGDIKSPHQRVLDWNPW